MTICSLRYVAPVALAMTLVACHSRTETTNVSGVDTTVTTAEPTNNGDTMAARSPAQTFVDKAAKSDAFEIAAAKLAQTNSQSEDVKAFATKMILAHTDSTAKIKGAATAASPTVSPDATLTDDLNSKLADLGKLKGVDFDKAYVAGQVDAHNEALTLMKNYAANGDAPTLKKVASHIVPVVQDHLVMARSLKLK